MRASIVIRTLNEARHLEDLLVMIARQKTDLEIETVLIDSGSTDGTVDIAERYGCRITTITKAEFSFGRSLNRGCAFSTGDILVFISGHCVPVRSDWLDEMCRPLVASAKRGPQPGDGTDTPSWRGQVVYTYGRQIGDDDSNYSERRIFAKYFPETSAVPQKGFLCNNANSALLRSVWEAHPFDEELTGLEDMELAKRLYGRGMAIGYVAEAPVFHHHQESWAQVRRRFEREALALRSILPEVHLSRFDVARYVLTSVLGDWRAASRNNIKSTSRSDMLRYRWNQYTGSYAGNHEHRRLSQEAKESFFYPQVTKEAELDDWLRPLRRPAPDESQQSESEGQELSTSAR